MLFRAYMAGSKEQNVWVGIANVFIVNTLIFFELWKCKMSTKHL